MATPKSQRIAIWVIAIVMGIGSLGAYFVVILANNNNTKASEDQQQALDAYYQQIKDQAKDNQVLSGYTVTTFTASDVTDLQKTDLVVGTGIEIKKDDKINVSYTGWLPDGTIFDSTTKKGTNTPADLQLSDGSLIPGWITGIPGMKVGGVRQLIIPADQAYGAQGSPPLIPANTPIEFIIRIEKIST